MNTKGSQEQREDQELIEDEDLPFELDPSISENQQNQQNEGGQEYEIPAEGEEWIARALAIVRVREAVALSAHGPVRQEQERTTKKKAQFLEVYAKNMATIGVACDKAEIERTTYYLWMKTDPQFRSAINQIDDSRIDMVEDELMQLIQKHDGPSIRFFLERKAPEYKAKSQTEIVTGDKTFEDLLYSQAEKRKALAEGKDPEAKKQNDGSKDK